MGNGHSHSHHPHSYNGHGGGVGTSNGGTRPRRSDSSRDSRDSADAEPLSKEEMETRFSQLVVRCNLSCTEPCITEGDRR